MKSSNGEFQLDTPRDRNASFEPEIVNKHQTHMSDELERKMLSLFTLVNSYSQISDHIEDMYGVHFSKTAITAVTDKLIPKLEEWKKRPLDEIYPFIYLDAIHYKVREEGRYISKAFYTVLGVNLSGKKEILGLYLNESEVSRFWMQV
jgi:transposase-like protein